jgi:hypothetical protein
LKKIDSQRGLPLGRPWVKGISGISHIGHDWRSRITHDIGFEPSRANYTYICFNNQWGLSHEFHPLNSSWNPKERGASEMILLLDIGCKLGWTNI